MKTGRNDARCIVWVLCKFFFPCFIITNKCIRYYLSAGKAYRRQRPWKQAQMMPDLDMCADGWICEASRSYDEFEGIEWPNCDKCYRVPANDMLRLLMRCYECWCDAVTADEKYDSKVWATALLRAEQTPVVDTAPAAVANPPTLPPRPQSTSLPANPSEQNSHSIPMSSSANSFRGSMQWEHS